MRAWTELQKDFLAETLNLGVGKAAKALSELLGEEILLSVPFVEFLQRHEIVHKFGEVDGDSLVAVTQDFAGGFDGSINLLFGAEGSLELVQAVLSDQLDSEELLADVEREAISEIGNIILNACMSVVADTLKCEVDVDLPVFRRGSPENVVNQQKVAAAEGEVCLFYHMDFAVKATGLTGFIVLFMSLESARSLHEQVETYLNSVIEASAAG